MNWTILHFLMVPALASLVIAGIHAYLGLHVVEGARSIRVKVARASNGPNPVFDGKLIGMDRQLDLALLQIEAAGKVRGVRARIMHGDLVRDRLRIRAPEPFDRVQ